MSDTRNRTGDEPMLTLEAQGLPCFAGRDACILTGGAHSDRHDDVHLKVNAQEILRCAKVVLGPDLAQIVPPHGV